MSVRPIPAAKLSQPKILWACALGGSLLLSGFAEFRGGYVGPRLLDSFAAADGRNKALRFFDDDPTGLLSPGSWAFSCLSEAGMHFPSLFRSFWRSSMLLPCGGSFSTRRRRFRSPVIHLAFVFFLTFLPVRVIHAATVGADSPRFPFLCSCFFFSINSWPTKLPLQKMQAFSGWD